MLKAQISYTARVLLITGEISLRYTTNARAVLLTVANVAESIAKGVQLLGESKRRSSLGVRH